jgi:hypothetical protein
MKPHTTDEIADRVAEERSESEGMPEHAAKARDPVRWAADRPKRASTRPSERSGIFVLGFVACAAAAAFTLARDAYRWVGQGRPGEPSRSGSRHVPLRWPGAPPVASPPY